MKFEIVGHPKFWFPLSVEQVAILIELSKSHYDDVCKMASHEGSRDAFLLGWSNMAQHNLTMPEGQEKMKMPATWRELDISLKILEGAFHFPEEKRQIAIRLSLAFHGALTAASVAMKGWNAEFEYLKS